MNNPEQNIDKLIRDALTEEEMVVFDDLGEQSLIDMMLGVFKGRLRFLSIAWAVITLVFFFGAIYTATQFFETDEPSELIMWGAAFFLMLGTVMSMKIWYWMEMQKNSIMRQIKRVELQVAHLASVLGSK